jgi:hypothetical protein
MDLRRRFLLQAEQCRARGSRLTAAVLEGAAADLVAGGITEDLLGPHREDPSGTVPSLRFAGSLHRLVLSRKAPELALHYPSVGGTASVEDVWPAAERACRDHLDELRVLMRRGVQTNEVGRAAALYGVLGMIGGPVRLLEIGASAGLNLRCDHFGYVVDGSTVLGDPAGPVQLQQPWQGTLPRQSDVGIVDRRGCDPAPIDPTTTEGRLTLTSYVWADQQPRLERLRGALDLAARVPAEVERAGALDFLTRELAVLPRGITTVVWHSVVWQYIDPTERKAVDRLLSDVGRRTRADAPLVRVSLEPEQAVGKEFTFRVHATRWPGGERVHLADAEGHGPPVVWTGATIGT